METKRLKRLPVGIQTFSEVIDLNCLYIDKTEYIWNMIHTNNCVFLFCFVFDLHYLCKINLLEYGNEGIETTAIRHSDILKHY